ncbi:lactonase family protein [Dyadobacter tibetensis]|uniref:lactonase family protein n=1 Tax=Dyadobacter tibetensis TaxID=1211851 RepID=UPI0005C46BB1|nr:lactonase family protein [Dyadobacter tibetensis]
MQILYVGSYSNRGAGIYVYAFEGELDSQKQIQVMQNENSPSFLAIHPNKKYLYSANEGNNTLTTYSIDPSNGKLAAVQEVSSQGQGPCHVSTAPDGQFLYVSNYGDGSLAVYQLQHDGQIGNLADHIQNQGNEHQKPHMHSIIPSADGRFVYASDLGLDQIVVFRQDNNTGKLQLGEKSVISLSKGDGPRHLSLHPNGRYAYSLGELNSVVNVFEIDKDQGYLSSIQRISMLPDHYKGENSAADIHISEDGQYLYASNRGHESIVIYEINPDNGLLQLSGHVPTQGRHPRNFLIDSKGGYAIVANRDDDNIVLFERNPKNGELKYSGQQIQIPAAVFVKILELN